MTVNYHTHTARCGHACGTDREYIEQAIQSGLHTLGFSDHVPVPFDGGYRSRIRMGTDELPEYMDSLLRLRSEYQKDIRILIGFEMEYYPKYFNRTLKMLSDYPVDYLILGQHFLDDEAGALRTTRPTDSPADLIRDVEQTLEGLSTGRFTYLAHPDTLCFTGDAALYEHWMRRLCEGAKELGVPLELNLTGFREECIYPCERFFRIAAEADNPVIMGFDAHAPSVLGRKDTVRAGERLAEKCGLTLLEDVEIRNPFI